MKTVQLNAIKLNVSLLGPQESLRLSLWIDTC